MRWLKCGRMSQDECPTKARMYTEKTKGRDNTLGRHRANRGRVRQQGASAPTERNTQGSKTKSPFCVVLKTYHLNTWILHKTCLKHSKFLHRKFCAHGTSWQQLWDRELKKTQRVETRFTTLQFQHKWKERKMVHLMRST